MIINGDSLAVLKTMKAQSVDCIVTSPPYWGLRDYGIADQIGLETTPEAFVQNIVAVFREARRVLKDTGTLWLNIGDTYASAGGAGHQGKHGYRAERTHTHRGLLKTACDETGLRPKNLVGIPWRVAFALQADGWNLRQDIIWAKPNPMPESVTDRCTKSHEYVFLFSKSEQYFWNQSAMLEPAVTASESKYDDGSNRLSSDQAHTGSTRKFRAGKAGNKIRTEATERGCPRDGVASGVPWTGVLRNRRSVWSIQTEPFKGAHFATMPTALARDCVLTGCPPGGTVLDPFAGAATTGFVALGNDRKFIGIELNPDYVALGRERLGLLGFLSERGQG